MDGLDGTGCRLTACNLLEKQSCLPGPMGLTLSCDRTGIIWPGKPIQAKLHLPHLQAVPRSKCPGNIAHRTLTLRCPLSASHHNLPGDSSVMPVPQPGPTSSESGQGAQPPHSSSHRGARPAQAPQS